MLRNILLGVGIFAVVLSVLIFSCKIPVGQCKQNGTSAKGDVQLWGTLPETQMNGVVQAFNPQAKTYAVRYRYIPESEFNQKLLEALASGQGPDLILTPYQMILSQKDRIQPFPLASFSEKSFKDTYVDGSSVLFGSQGALALPVSIEPMVLFYNRNLFSKHGIVNPPQYWDEITELSPTLTIKDSNNRFLESAIALGTPDVTYAKDIIMTIVEQLGQSPVIVTPNPTGDPFYSIQVNDPVHEGDEVLPLATVNRYFTQFSDSGQKAFTWRGGLGDVADIFVAEKLAMYVGYSGEFATLRARNPRAQFEMTYLPQIRGQNNFATGMRMYAIGTLKASKNLSTALTVESQFAGSGVSPTIAGFTGGVPALRSFATSPSIDPVVAKSMLVAHGWYDSHYVESSRYVTSMISDIINYRYGISDASAMFVARLRDLYSKN